MMIPRSLESLERQRAKIVEQIVQLHDLRRGSLTSTTGRCGKPDCRCHQPKQPPHGPNLRLTYKVASKTVTESLPNPAAVLKAKWAMHLKGGMVIANPIPEAFAMPRAAIDQAIEQALQEATQQGIAGKESTPFLLARVCALTGGDSLASNIQLVLNNARLAAAIAIAYVGS